MGKIIEGIVGAILNALGGANNAGDPLEEVKVGFIHIAEVIRNMADALSRLFGGIRGAWQFAKPHTIGAAEAIGNTAYNQDQMWARLLDTILPHSLKWLDGALHKWAIGHFQPQINRLARSVKFLMGWRGQIDHWRKTQVDPELHKLMSFRKLILGWPMDILKTWRDWFAHPAHFAKWAAAPLIGPTLAYYADRKHKLSRDMLTATVVDATPDVWRHAEAATVRILLTKVD